MSSLALLPTEERAEVLQEAAERLDLTLSIVEKDFWVCWSLGRLFALEDAAELTFKGGTSLSKVFGVIERFSEDVDLSVSPAFLGWAESDLDLAPSASMRVKRMAKLERDCIRTVEAHFQPRLEEAIRKVLGSSPAGRWLRFEIDAGSNSPVLLFEYPRSSAEVSEYIDPGVKIEFGSLTDQRPKASHRVEALVAEAAPGQFDDLGAGVVALDLERTFWEKATILHAEHHRPAHQPIRSRFARHYADLAALWRHPGGRAASERPELLERVATFKQRFFRSAWSSYETARPGSLKLAPPPNREAELRDDLRRMRSMFFGAPPSFDEILAGLREAETAINEP